MFFIPIFNEDFEFKRLPFITIFIILLNVIVFIFTSQIVSRQMKGINKINVKLYNITIELIMENKNIEYMEKGYPVIDANFLERIKSDTCFDHESNMYKEWENCHNQFEDIRSQLLYYKWGATPEKLSIITLISAMFIHGSFFHLFFNMLFLWLVGLNIEDDWGRPVFLSIYLIGGIISTLVYSAISADKSIPLIGASGAISVVMGAFMIRHFKTRIRYFYFILLIFYPLWGFINIPAFVVLPLWFIQQIFGASMSAKLNSGVAYWAHISGFLFGAVAGLFIKFTGLEKNILEPLIEEEREKIKISNNMQMALDSIDNSKYKDAINFLKIHLQEHRNDIDALNLLITSMVKTDNKLEASHYCEYIAERADMLHQDLMNLYVMMTDDNIFDYATPKTLLIFSNYFLNKSKYVDAIDMCIEICKKDNVKLKRLALLKIIKLNLDIEKYSQVKEYYLILKRNFPDSIELINAYNLIKSKGLINEK